MIPRDQNNNEFLQFCESYYWPKYKDPESIKWWSTRENDIKVKSSNKSPSFRYNFYNNVMHRYPKVHLPDDKFVRQLPRLQNYLAMPKNWKDNNKNGQRKEFLEHFSLQKWESLSNKEKLDHRLHDYPPCEHSNSELFCTTQVCNRIYKKLDSFVQ